MKQIFAQRLINARKIRCISQRDLSKLVKLSPTAIAKYEKGLIMPSSTMLIAFSKALDFKLDYFFRPFTISIDASKFEFRKKSSLRQKQVESIKYLVCSQIEKYIEIENLLNIKSDFVLNYRDYVVESEEDAINLATKFRKDLNIGLGAIVSSVELLESIGIKIIEIDADDKFDGTCNNADSIPIIVVNKNANSERKRLTIFHELGHLILNYSRGVDEEKMCTIFANEILIPSEQIKAIIGESRHDISLIELQSMQKEYGISVDALMAKAKQLNIITENRYASFHKKKNALPDFKKAVEKSIYPMEHTNRYERLVYRALASDIITTSKAASFLNTSVNEIRNNLNLI